MSIRLIAGDVPEEGLPPSALQSKGFGRWGDAKQIRAGDVHLEIRPHALFRADDSVATLDEVTVVISGFVYSTGAGQRGQDVVRNLSESYRRGLEHFHTAVSRLEGEFSGTLVDAKHRRLHVFSNKCGTVPLYFSKHGDNVVVSCHLLEHAVLMNHLGIPIDIDPMGAMAYLGHGGMVDHATLLRGVERVLPGEVIAIDRTNGRIQKTRYFLFSNDATGPVGDEAAEALDAAFTNVIRRQYQLDLNLGKRHIGSLSGGLDSRMDAVVAFESGYQDRVNYTFGDPGSQDVRIAEEISGACHQSQITIGLSGGSFIISSLRAAAILNGGISVAAGACHGVFAASCVDWSEYGLLHTGQIGDAVLGSFLTGPGHSAPNAGAGGISSLFADEFSEEKAAAAAAFENHELFLFYTRAFLTANGGLAMMLPIVPTISPFLDTEFLKTSLSIPPEERWKKKAYFHWIRKMRPAAGKFAWEKTGSRPGAIQIRGRTPRVWGRYFSRRLRARFCSAANRRLILTGMNPFDKWEQENPALGGFISEEFSRVGHLGMEILGEEKWSKAMKVVKEGTCMQRLHVLSFLFTVEELTGVSAPVSTP